jgi:cell division septal protein FtsQ
MKKKKKYSTRIDIYHQLRNHPTVERPPFPSPRFVLGVLILAVLGYGVYRLSTHLIRNSDMFILKKIQVDGNQFIESGDIIRKASLQPGNRIFQIPVKEVSNRVLKNPYLKGVSISRALPSTLIISVQEREPVAYLIDQKIYMIDKYGIILLKKSGMSIKNLPLITGLSVQRLLKDRQPLLDALKLIELINEVDSNLLQFISEIHIDANQPPQLYLVRGGAKVVIGKEKFPERIFILSEFIKTSSFLNKIETVKKIDLTFQGRVILTRKR